jgi:hypothetical protein
MGDFPTYRVRETLLSRKPREWSLEIAALFLSIIMGISLLAWRNGAALLPTLAATSEGALKQGKYWRLLTATAVHRGRYAPTLECDSSDLLHLPALWILRLLGFPGDESGHGRIDQLNFAAHLDASGESAIALP